MAGKQKHYEDDDGHTIADMNLDGMPWYDPSRRPGGRETDHRSPMSPTERRATLLAVVLSALLISAAFGIVYFLVIALLDSAARGL